MAGIISMRLNTENQMIDIERAKTAFVPCPSCGKGMKLLDEHRDFEGDEIRDPECCRAHFHCDRDICGIDLCVRSHVDGCPER